MILDDGTSTNHAWTLDEYQNFCLETAHVYRDEAYALAGYNRESSAYLMFCKMYAALGLGEAGEIQGKVKKLMRDSKDWTYEQHEAHREAVALELGDYLWYAGALADEYGFTLQEIAKKNVKKLLERRKKGTLQGDGDNR